MGISILVGLADAPVMRVPLAWSWRLSEARPAQRPDFCLTGAGHGLRWPEADEDISVEGLLHGTPAPRPRPSAAAARQGTIRIISTRPVTRNEREQYESEAWPQSERRLARTGCGRRLGCARPLDPQERKFACQRSDADNRSGNPASQGSRRGWTTRGFMRCCPAGRHLKSCSIR